jgi:hypothetical protein
MRESTVRDDGEKANVRAIKTMNDTRKSLTLNRFRFKITICEEYLYLLLKGERCDMYLEDDGRYKILK